ncbi:hypothetical protein ELBI_59 [Anabaena phage Elbi]|nr:hypothetical protein ELBI_59 [Anabaena phage Elbi]
MFTRLKKNNPKELKSFTKVKKYANGIFRYLLGLCKVY